MPPPSQPHRALLERAVLAALEGDYSAACSSAHTVLESGVSGEERLSVYRLLIDWNRAIGDAVECKRLASRAVREGSEDLGQTHEAVLVARNSELYWMCMVGYDSVAKTRFASLIKDVKKTLGATSDLMWAVRVNSAMPAKLSGDFKRAAAIYRELAADMEKVVAPSDIALLTVRDNLAEVLALADDFDEARRVYAALLDTLVAEFGEEDWRCLRVRGEIAEIDYYRLGYDQVLDQWLDLIADYERAGAPGSEGALRMVSLLIAAAIEAEDFQTARTWLARLIADPPSELNERDVEELEAMMREYDAGLAPSGCARTGSA